MPVRLKITFLFTILVVLILAVVCTSIYVFFQSSRSQSVQANLVSRAITVARLLTQREFFSSDLIQKIDASRSYILKNNSIQAYNHDNQLIYRYTSTPADSMPYNADMVARARRDGVAHYHFKEKDAVAYLYHAPNESVVIVTSGEDEEGKQLGGKLVKILAISFFAGISLAALGGYFFSKTLLRPVDTITADVTNISALNLSRRIEPGRVKDEWYHLATTVNDLLDRLQESFDTQKRFIANASHEISTPLTSISSQIEVSLQRERDAENYKQVLQSIYHDVVHLTNLTQTLLQFAQASGTPGGLVIELVRIDEVLLRLPYEISTLKKGYSVNLSFNDLPVEAEKLLVFGNENLLLIAVKNIVENACKYSNDHNAVVALAVIGKMISIRIIDTGVGIPVKEFQNIFQPFYRVADVGEKGVGLGLSLASRIVALHKGMIDVQSTTGKGTTFTITIPGAKEFGNIK
jgi:two-component system sensor histidine kinase ArlS